jgi:HAD superfamily hydrolase (TIGR01509 family)
MKFQAVIFDMDGLMLDTEPLYWDTARKIAARYDRTVSDATLRKMMGRGLTDSMKIYIDECGLNAPVEELMRLREQYMLERYAAGVEPMAGLSDILKQFYGKLKLAVATSSHKLFTDVLLPVMKIDHYFDVVQTSDGIKNGKPNPEIYLTCMAKLNVAPKNCIVLEDSPAGARAGKSSGAYVIAVPSHLTASEDFSFADERVNDLIQASSKLAALLCRGSDL